MAAFCNEIIFVVVFFLPLWHRKGRRQGRKEDEGRLFQEAFVYWRHFPDLPWLFLPFFDWHFECDHTETHVRAMHKSINFFFLIESFFPNLSSFIDLDAFISLVFCACVWKKIFNRRAHSSVKSVCVCVGVCWLVVSSATFWSSILHSVRTSWCLLCNWFIENILYRRNLCVCVCRCGWWGGRSSWLELVSLSIAQIILNACDEPPTIGGDFGLSLLLFRCKWNFFSSSTPSSHCWSLFQPFFFFCSHSQGNSIISRVVGATSAQG